MFRKTMYFLAVVLFCIPVFVLAEGFSDDSSAIEMASDSVVLLECYDKSGELYCTGSAFAAFEDRVFITNYHVIEQEVYRIVAKTEDGLMFEISTVLATDPERDIAILQTEANPRIPLLSIGDSDSLKRGEKVIAIGSPLGLLNTVSMGIFGGYNDTGVMKEILFSASISSGSSGGALFNDSGEVIGVTYASYTEGQNLNVAVPIAYAEELYQQNGDAMSVAQFYESFDHFHYREMLVKDVMSEKTTLQEDHAKIYGFIADIRYDETLGNAELILVNDSYKAKESQRLVRERARAYAKYDESHPNDNSMAAMLERMRATNSFDSNLQWFEERNTIRIVDTSQNHALISSFVIGDTICIITALSPQRAQYLLFINDSANVSLISVPN